MGCEVGDRVLCKITSQPSKCSGWNWPALNESVYASFEEKIEYEDFISCDFEKTTSNFWWLIILRKFNDWDEWKVSHVTIQARPNKATYNGVPCGASHLDIFQFSTVGGLYYEFGETIPSDQEVGDCDAGCSDGYWIGYGGTVVITQG